jgi:hypothetical protein
MWCCDNGTISEATAKEDPSLVIKKKKIKTSLIAIPCAISLCFNRL